MSQKSNDERSATSCIAVSDFLETAGNDSFVYTDDDGLADLLISWNLFDQLYATFQGKYEHFISSCYIGIGS